MKVLATYSIKGGVGKTTTAVNLAYLAAAGGARTLVWDLDPQGAATFFFRVRPSRHGKRLLRGKRHLLRSVRGTDFELLDLLPADFAYRHLDRWLDRFRRPTRRLARLLRPLAAHYDWVFLDCAPGITLASETVFEAADALIVPALPTPLSMRTVKMLRKQLKRGDGRCPELLPFFSMFDGRRSLHREIGEQAAEAPARFLSSRVLYSSIVERMGRRREPLASFAPSSAPARAYEALWSEIRARLGDTTRG